MLWLWIIKLMSSPKGHIYAFYFKADLRWKQFTPPCTQRHISSSAVDHPKEVILTTTKWYGVTYRGQEQRKRFLCPEGFCQFGDGEQNRGVLLPWKSTTSGIADDRERHKLGDNRGVEWPRNWRGDKELDLALILTGGDGTEPNW